jgi:GT2 family glycosyltransferase
VIRREVLARLGGFDESFGSYLEDVDLGLRCVRADVRGVYVPDAVSRHRGSATFGRWSARATRLIARNQVLLVARHFDRELFRAFWWPVVVGQLLWGLVALRHGRGLAWLGGKVEGLRGFRLTEQPSASLRSFLLASENELRQRATADLYWRWYFRLAGRRRNQMSAAH